jgi:O-antigen/teichoic acid export membrane protein
LGGTAYNFPKILLNAFITLSRRRNEEADPALVPLSGGLFGGLAIGFISFPIFTRIFSVADYGMIDFIQKILLVPTALSKAGMQNSVLRFYNEKEFSSNRQSARSYYSTMLFGVGAMAVAITLVFLVAVKLLLRH